MADLNATIAGVSISFFTHNDNKDHDTSVTVVVRNKINFFLTQDIAKLENFSGNTEYKDNPPSTHAVDLTLVSNNIQLSQLNVPTTTITITPVGHDRWIFDYTVTIVASDGSQFSSTEFGIILDQDNRTHTGVFGA